MDKNNQAVWLIVIVGTIISSLLFAFTRNAELDNIHKKFNEISDSRALAFENEVESDLESILALYAFYKASEFVSREEFKIFTGSEVGHHVSIQALEWIPRVPEDKREAYETRARQAGFAKFRFTEKNSLGKMVPAGSRPEYFPVYYVEPVRGNEAAIGFDLASNLTRLETLKKSRDSGEMSATPRITLVQETSEQYGFLAFLPIYNGNPATVKERRDSLWGFLLGVFRIRDIFETAMQSGIDRSGEVNTEIFDESSPGKESLLNISPARPVSDSFRHRNTIAVAGRTWSMVSWPTEDFISSRRSLQIYIILVAGLLLTGALSTFVWFQERHHAEVTRIADELTQFINNSNSGIFGINRQGIVDEWNLKAEKDHNFSRNEVIGKDSRHFLHKMVVRESQKPLAKAIEKAMMGEQISNLEFKSISKSGETYVNLLSLSTRRDSDGNIVGIMGISQNITELDRYRSKLESLVDERTKESKISLGESEEARDRIDAILKSVADGLIVTDTSNNIILMNRAAEDLLNIRFSEVINRAIDFAIEDKTLLETVKTTFGKMTTGYEFNFTLLTDDPDKPRIMKGKTAVIHDKAGEPAGNVTIMYDITREKEIDRMKTEFISTAAHELRTPITSIQGFSEILITRDNLKPKEKIKFLGYINEQAIGLEKIISDLLDISRLESGMGFALNKTECKVGSTIKRMIPQFQAQTSKHIFETTLPKKETIITLDKEKMGQALTNILSNAIKYSPDGGTINVKGEVIGDEYHISVKDEGIGMTADQLEKIFDKFYRVDSSNTAISGTGLGMSIAKYIVELHGGTIAIESEIGKGTSVIMTIPIHNKESNET